MSPSSYILCVTPPASDRPGGARAGGERLLARAQHPTAPARTFRRILNGVRPSSNCTKDMDQFAGSIRRRAIVLSLGAAVAPALPTTRPLLALAAEETGNQRATPPFEKLPRGLGVLKLRDGSGPMPEQGDIVEINFTGRLASKQGWYFENTYNNKGKDGFPIPFEFSVGGGAVIEGLDEAVRQMRKGEILRAVIPPQLSYQNTSQGPVPREWSNRRRLYSTVLNEVRLANGEGDTLATVVLDLELMSIRKH